MQQARQRIENWQRGFRLGNKIVLQVERPDADEASGAKKEGKAATSGASIRVLVRVDFSDHEKLSRQRWLERIPADDAFKSAKHQKISPADANYAETEEAFTTLASGAAAKKFQQQA